MICCENVFSLSLAAIGNQRKGMEESTPVVSISLHVCVTGSWITEQCWIRYDMCLCSFPSRGFGPCTLLFQHRDSPAGQLCYLLHIQPHTTDLWWDNTLQSYSNLSGLMLDWLIDLFIDWLKALCNQKCDFPVLYTVPVKSLNTCTHSRVFLYFCYFLHYRKIVKTSKLWNNTWNHVVTKESVKQIFHILDSSK